MNLVRCEKGHFYDGDKFKTCPHCTAGEDDRSVTIAAQEVQDKSLTQPQDEGKTMGSTALGTEKMSFQEAVSTVSSTTFVSEDDDMVKTTGIYSGTIDTEPVVGWLVAVSGVHFGQCFELKAGRNFIGRAREMDIRLEGDDSISRNKHAVVVYEPKSKIFIAQPGESRELFYVNDKVVLNNEQIHKNDILLLGKTKLMLIPCCDEQFCWEDVQDEK